MAKKEVGTWPFVASLARLQRTVFVDRNKRVTVGDTAGEITQRLSTGDTVVLFAEGGTGDGVSLTPFRASLFVSANEARAIVQPVAVDYGARAGEIAWPHGAGFKSELLRMLNRPAPVPVTLRFLAPLDGSAIDRKLLATETYAAVAGALGLAHSVMGRQTVM